MGPTISTELLMRLAQATPEQHAAIERFLGMGDGCRGRKLRHLTPAPSPIEAEREKAVPEEEERPAVWGKHVYILRRHAGGWVLVLGGRDGLLPDGKALRFVDCLLKGRRQVPIHGSVLARRACGEAVVEGQRNPGLDDRETMAAKNKSRRECLAVLEDEGASDLEKREAAAELAEIEAWARKHLRGTEAGEQRQVRAVRQALRRLLAWLAKARDHRGEPDTVLRAFGEHLHRYLWVPSARGARARSSRLRAGLAGCFTYEAPDGVRWRG